MRLVLRPSDLLPLPFYYAGRLEAGKLAIDRIMQAAQAAGQS